MPSRSKAVAVTVEVWKELSQDMMLIVHDALEQTHNHFDLELDIDSTPVHVGALVHTPTSVMSMKMYV